MCLSFFKRIKTDAIEGDVECWEYGDGGDDFLTVRNNV